MENSLEVPKKINSAAISLMAIHLKKTKTLIWKYKPCVYWGIIYNC